MSRERFNIIVTIKRNEQPAYSNVHNHQPLRPGKVESALTEAIESVMSNVTRGGKYNYDGIRTATMFVGKSISEGVIIVVFIEVVRA
jgi:hypothetical protein